MELELKMHLEITNSQRFHQFCCCCSNLVSASQSSPVGAEVLESSIVITEGVTLVLIVKEERKKTFPRPCFHLYDSGYTHSVITACRLSFLPLCGVCVCVGLFPGMYCQCGPQLASPEWSFWDYCTS